MWLSGNLAITNSNCDSASHWNMPRWIFTFADLFPRVVNCTFSVSMAFLMNIMTSSGIIFILRQCNIQICGTISWAFLSYIQAIARFFRHVLLSLRMCWSIYCSSPVFPVSLWYLFFSSEKSPRLINELITSVIWAVSIFHIIGWHFMGL